MLGASALLILCIVIGVLAYQRASLYIWLFVGWLLIVFAVRFHVFSILQSVSGICLMALFSAFSISSLRCRFISQQLYTLYHRLMPSISQTEEAAMAAGTLTWEAELFSGAPAWQTLLNMPVGKLNEEEQAFINGPVEQLCNMIDDWDMTHALADLPACVWTFLKKEGFFGLIIPKQYGGKQFSAYAHSEILMKISARSAMLAITVMVPNSLGPAELLLQYGTKAQKEYYLSRLASGKEIPCFALTSAEAGSDAGAMTDYGIVCFDQDKFGQRVTGIRLNWNKRYITLAPISTVIGLAFKLYDPDGILGQKKDIGITCALIPRETKGITIGRRHYPLYTPFQNGPIQGKDVFIPLDWIIGGVEQAGLGWQMLMECLAAGRGISLPSSAVGGSKKLCYLTCGYARIRKQFHFPLGCFEGIAVPLAQMVRDTYVANAARALVISAIDQGEKPSIASAIVKYHTTELARKVMLHAMDVHGGKALCLGKKNYIASSYAAVPISITVEGANILTRNMIIFGQGVFRCHPYVALERQAVSHPDPTQRLILFDRVIMQHIGFAISNAFRCLILACCGSRVVDVPFSRGKRYFQHATRFSTALALMTDVAIFCLGGQLKRKENLSARLGDIFSYLYLLSAILKWHHSQGEPKSDWPLVELSCKTYFYLIQQSIDDWCANFPRRWIGKLLRRIVFPFGQYFKKPVDQEYHIVAQLSLDPTVLHEHLTKEMNHILNDDHILANMNDALLKTIAAEPIEKIIKQAKQAELIEGYTLLEQAQSAFSKQVITVEQLDLFIQAVAARKKIIAVDDFEPDQLIK